MNIYCGVPGANVIQSRRARYGLLSFEPTTLHRQGIRSEVIGRTKDEDQFSREEVVQARRQMMVEEDIIRSREIL